MAKDREEVVEIDAKGMARPLGEIAALRMQGRQGRFAVLPSPPHMLVMRKLEGTKGLEARNCLLSGEIRSAGAICDIVGLIGHAGWNGELLVLDRSSGRSLFFDQSHVVGAQSTIKTERLGDVLYRYGILDREQVARCSDATATGALRFGETAVKFGFVTREKLFSIAARQLEEIFYGVLLVEGGMFYFLDSYEESSLSIRQKLSVPTLIREGVRRMHETRYFRARIPSNQHVPALSSDRLPPQTELAEMCKSIDGARSVADICRIRGQSEFEVCRALFQLVQSGHVIIKPPRLTAKDAVEVCNQAAGLILRELDAMDSGDTVREQLASFAAKGDVYPVLLAGAGPADDGTFDAARVADNVLRINTRDGADAMLSQWLYEYASYALFVARPHLHRGQAAREPGTEETSLSKRLSQRVSAVLEPIAPPATLPGEPKK